MPELTSTAEVKKGQERLALALQASRMGMWEWDVVTGRLIWSDELKQIFGLKPNEIITYQKYQDMIYPDDRDAMQAVVDQAMVKGTQYQVEHRIVWPDGSVHWLMGQGKAYFEHGKPVRMLGTSMNIDERKAAEARTEALAQERTELVALNSAKDEFISLASHQLRTPATAVKQYLGMLLEGYAGDLPREQHMLLKLAYDSNERQITIVNDLLKVAHVDAGQVIIKKEKTDLVKLVNGVVHDQAAVFEARNQHIVLNHKPMDVYADVDSDKIRMVLENIIDNASKYTPVGRQITITISAHKHTVTVKVEDQGVGIAKKDIAKLFQKFSRINNELSAEVGGSGLGLYWTKKIVDLHGGNISVESRVHKGSTFIVELPRE